VFDVTLSLEEIADGYRAVDEGTAIKPCSSPDGPLSQRHQETTSMPRFTG